MHSLFDVDSPLMSGLGKIFDCIVLSICWVIGSLPVLTMGTSCGALYRTVYRCIRKDEGHALQMFWTTWVKNLKTGIITWLPVLGLFAFLIADALILRGLVSEGSPVAKLLGIVLVLLAVSLVWAAYVTAYAVRFEGTLKEILWLCLFLVLSHPLTTVVIFLFLAMGVAIALMVPFLVLFLPVFICLAMSFPMESVFLKHMRPEDVERVKNGE